MSDPVIVVSPSSDTPVLPLVFDSPHSGFDYPEDMRSILSNKVLRQTEDVFIDALFGHVPVLGATLILTAVQMMFRLMLLTAIGRIRLLTRSRPIGVQG